MVDPLVEADDTNHLIRKVQYATIEFQYTTSKMTTRDYRQTLGVSYWKEVKNCNWQAQCHEDVEWKLDILSLALRYQLVVWEGHQVVLLCHIRAEEDLALRAVEDESIDLEHMDGKEFSIFLPSWESFVDTPSH